MQTVVRKANNTTPKKLVVKKATAKKAAKKGSYDAIIKNLNEFRQSGKKIEFVS